MIQEPLTGMRQILESYRPRSKLSILPSLLSQIGLPRARPAIQTMVAMLMERR
jgi:hypothetical protein